MTGTGELRQTCGGRLDGGAGIANQGCHRADNLDGVTGRRLCLVTDMTVAFRSRGARERHGGAK